MAKTATKKAATLKKVAANLKDATKVYGDGETQVTALKKVSVNFEKGKFTAIMGPSGSGKSTLIQCAAGLDKLTSGQALIDGVDLGELNDKNLTLLRREKVGFVFQAYNLIPFLTAAENIQLPLSIAGDKPDQAWYEQIVKVLGLGSRQDHTPNELSGGQQQRVAVARALASKPKIIFADEPSGNLDSKSGAELLGFMRSSVDEYGQTIVMVTHDPTAAAYADRIIFLDDGKIVDEMLKPTANKILDKLKSLGD